MYKYSQSRILIFAREPVRGKVKTRLHGALGPDRSLALHCALLRYQVATVNSSSLAPWELWVQGNPHHALFRELAGDKSVYVQRGNDLGARMSSAASDALESSESILLLGSDCPSVDVHYLDDALSHLAAGRDLVAGPALDGGYVLLGLRRLWPQLFVGIDWGSDRVMAQTEAVINQLQLDWVLMEPRWDVDRPADLPRLQSLQPPLEF